MIHYNPGIVSGNIEPVFENTVPVWPSCSLQALGYKQEGQSNKNGSVFALKFLCTILATTSFKKYIKEKKEKRKAFEAILRLHCEETELFCMKG